MSAEFEILEHVVKELVSAVKNQQQTVDGGIPPKFLQLAIDRAERVNGGPFTEYTADRLNYINRSARLLQQEGAAVESVIAYMKSVLKPMPMATEPPSYASPKRIRMLGFVLESFGRDNVPKELRQYYDEEMKRIDEELRQIDLDRAMAQAQQNCGEGVEEELVRLMEKLGFVRG